MQVEMLRFDGRAWSKPFPALDSDRTLVTVFGASAYVHDPEPMGTCDLHNQTMTPTVVAERA